MKSATDPIAAATRPYLLAGVALVVAAGTAIGIWSAIARIDGAVVAPGRVAVDGNRKAVQHAHGGVVASLYVSEGREVRAGDLLVRLDATGLEASRRSLRARLDALLARRERLVAERDGRSRLDFGSELAGVAADPERAPLLVAERSRFRARERLRTSAESLVAERIARLETEASAHDFQVATRSRQVEAVAGELEAARKLVALDLLPRLRLLTLERQLAEAEALQGQHRADARRARDEIDEVRIEGARAALGFANEVLLDLERVREEIVRLREQLTQAELELERTAIRAPVSGRAIELGIHTVGGVVRAGETLLEIVPTAAATVVEARVPVADVERVRRGQPANVRLAGLDGAPVVEGEVAVVSADRVEDPRTGHPFYAVRIRVPPASLSELDGVALQPGMPADVLIRTGEKAAAAYAIEPLRSGWARAFTGG